MSHPPPRAREGDAPLLVLRRPLRFLWNDLGRRRGAPGSELYTMGSSPNQIDASVACCAPRRR
ncbi:hypothetical protein Taro_007051 [Colocasia esculenta]|uniref:Uncharacterized protein n=1 Tax=Colocasia esculenta TaxID=4460 RepID=A0A843U2Q7_COLES|nr:hypothetical protein [Colocasia esculenta]